MKESKDEASEKYISEIGSHLSIISSLKEEISSISLALSASNSRAKQLSSLLTSEAELREEMSQVLEENVTLKNELDTEREHLRELITLQIGYEDELSQHWAEILAQVDGKYTFF